MPALDIVNDVLLGGMKVVGELFGSGQMQLPFVLQSAETMKAAVAHLEPHMERVGGSSAKGKLVIATVKGDVHDIGKNLVDIICTNNGYEVHNLGIKVPIGEMVAKVKEVDADALGMSGLLVKSTLIMRDNLEELNSLGLTEVPVLLGGAALTRRYVERDLREIYEGRLFYGRDAFEGLSTLDALMGMKRTGEWDPDFGRVPTGRELPARSDAADTGAVELPRRSPDVGADNEVFTPPFLGYAGRQGHRPSTRSPSTSTRRRCTATSGSSVRRRTPRAVPESDDDFKARIRATFREQLAAAKASGVLVPQVVYGYFCASGDGDDLVVWTDESRTEEAARLHYPRQKVAPYLCIADFVRPIESDELDYVAFHIVTMGAAVSEATAKLFADNEYQQYLLLHGLGVEMAEALAEHWHHRIREEWGFVADDGPTTDRPVPPAVPRRPLLVGLPGVPRPRGQRHRRPPARRRPPGHRGRRGDRLAVPTRADHLGDHPPPPPSQVLRRPLKTRFSSVFSGHGWPPNLPKNDDHPPPAHRHRRPAGTTRPGARVRALDPPARRPRRRCARRRRRRAAAAERPAPGEWVVVYTFEDYRSLEAWTRLARPHGAHRDRQRPRRWRGPRADRRPRHPSRSTSRRSARSACGPRPSRSSAPSTPRSSRALADSPGFLRCDLFEPVTDVQDDTVTVLAFDSRANLDRWLHSEDRRQILERMEQFTEGDRTLNVVGGFAGWFPTPGGRQVKKWKTAVVVLMAIVPITLLYTAVRLTFFPDAHVVLAGVIGNIVSVALLTWVAMPSLTSWLQRWLQR